MAFKLIALLTLLLATTPLFASDQPSRFRDFFPISGWWGPSKDQVTEQVYRDMAEAGLTLSLAHPSYAVDFGRRAGLRMIIHDERSMLAQKAETEAESNEIVDSLVEEYGGDRWVVGFSVRDEPMPSEFPELARVSKRMLEKAPGCFPFINLFPTYHPDWWDDIAKYEAYVRQFVNEVKPPILCFDHYPMILDTVRPEYYQNLDVIRRASMDAGIPFWGFIHLTGHGPARMTTEPELRFQVFSHLAWGAKGISYFCYWLPAPDSANDFEGAIVDMNGKRTEHFPIAQRINRRVQAMGKHLINCRSTGVYHIGNIPMGCLPLPEDAPIQPKEGWKDDHVGRLLYSAGQLTFGFFDHADGSKWVLIVNRDYAHNLRTRFSVGKGIRALEEVGGHDSTGSQAFVPEGEDRLVTMNFAPGDGRLFRLVAGE